MKGMFDLGIAGLITGTRGRNFIMIRFADSPQFSPSDLFVEARRCFRDGEWEPREYCCWEV